MSYWELVHQRAWAETKELLDLTQKQLVIAVLVGCIYLLLVWQGVGEHEARSELWLRVCLSFAPLLAWPLVYLLRFSMVPAAIYTEQEILISALAIKKKTHEERKRIRRDLGAFAMQAVQLMNICDDLTQPVPESEMQKLQDKIQAYLEKELELSYIAFFRSPARSQFMPITEKTDRGRAKAGWKFRNERLIELVEKFRD